MEGLLSTGPNPSSFYAGTFNKFLLYFFFHIYNRCTKYLSSLAQNVVNVNVVTHNSSRIQLAQQESSTMIFEVFVVFPFLSIYVKRWFYFADIFEPYQQEEVVLCK